MRIPIAVALLPVFALAAWTLSAQSLADVARKEEARRQSVKDDGRDTAKVYTNKDLRGVPPPPQADATAASASKPTTSPAPAATTPEDEKSGASSTEQGKTEQRNEAYWKKRMQALRDGLERDRTLASALQSRVNALTTDFTNRDDPAQRVQIGMERQKAMAELDRIQKSVAAGVKAIAELEEEARRAGVPPGWLR